MSYALLPDRKVHEAPVPRQPAKRASKKAAACFVGWTAALVLVMTWILAEHPDWVRLALGLVCVGFAAGGVLSILGCLLLSVGRGRPQPFVANTLVLVRDSRIRVSVSRNL